MSIHRLVWFVVALAILASPSVALSQTPWEDADGLPYPLIWEAGEGFDGMDQHPHWIAQIIVKSRENFNLDLDRLSACDSGTPVLVKFKAARDGETAADLVFQKFNTEISNYRQSGMKEINISLKQLAVGGERFEKSVADITFPQLFHHVDDGYCSGPTAPPCVTTITQCDWNAGPDDFHNKVIWVTNGMTSTDVPAGLTPATASDAAKTWMEDFLDRLDDFHQAETLPTPHRFYFDSEGLPSTLNNKGNFQNADMIGRMAANTDKWDDEVVLEWDTDLVSGRSLADLWKDYCLETAGAETCPLPVPSGYDWCACGNRTFSTWWFGLVNEALDRALDLAIYEQIHAAYPGSGIKTANYVTSVRASNDIVNPLGDA